MKKGFTLIELLAVIVILAIIALIATPIILGIIEDARVGSIEASANGYIDAVEYNSARLELKGEELSDGTYDVTKLEIDLDGEKPSSGVITIEKGKVENATLIINDKIVHYNGSVSKVIESKEKTYKEAILNGADPVLKDELVPVIITHDGKVLKSNTNIPWYSYEDKQWANAVILFENKDYKNWEEIPESNIKEYYVWIPRYSYKLWNVNGDNIETKLKPIEIVFGSKAKTTGTNNGDMYIHPAFKNFNTQGIWVGKFELSYNEETYIDTTKFLSANPNIQTTSDPKELIIKPNVRSLIGKNVSEFHTLIYNSHRNLDSHMMTNMEWGAIAYLTYSIYGRCDENSCTEVTNNNVTTGFLWGKPLFQNQWQWSPTITGCAADNIDDDVNMLQNINEINRYNTKKGVLASTTGNITGIYDMSGGSWEYVMGVLVTEDGKEYSGQRSSVNSGFKGTYGCPECEVTIKDILENTDGLDFPELKYYNKYFNSKNTIIEYSGGLLGDATKEVVVNSNIEKGGKTYFDDYASFVYKSGPWFIRGGGFYDLKGSGIFNFGAYEGQGNAIRTSRAVLAF